MSSPARPTEALLYALLRESAPSAHWIRGLLYAHFGEHPLFAEFPDPSVSVAQYAQEAAAKLLRDGLIDEALLDYVEHVLPGEANRVNDIRRSLKLRMHIELPVSIDLLTDNWVYQDIAELFAFGPKIDTWLTVHVSDTLQWTPLCWTGLALESLLSVLSGIVLRDRFLVEEQHISAWTNKKSPVLALHASDILHPIAEPDGSQQLRSRLYREFFQAPPLWQWHLDNAAAYRETGRSRNEYSSAVLWGSIGYLARSALLGVTYVGHPVRRKFLGQTPLVQPGTGAVERTLATLDAIRAKYIAATEDATTRLIRYILPPLLVDILENSRTYDELILVALQYREKYKDLRRWLAHFQKALHENDSPRIREYEATLATVGASFTGTATCTINYDVASRIVQSQAGLHRPSAMILERVARTKPGEAVLDRLLDLFEISGTALELPVLTHLRMHVMTAESGT